MRGTTVLLMQTMLLHYFTEAFTGRLHVAVLHGVSMCLA